MSPIRTSSQKSTRPSARSKRYGVAALPADAHAVLVPAPEMLNGQALAYVYFEDRSRR
jgi:hypothetical protein